MALKVGPIVAARLFLKDAKLPMAYIEAVANAIDWGATEIHIHIRQADSSKPSTLSIVISDNGSGIDKDGLDRFANLSKPLDEAHRGLGRLAFVANFNQVKVTTRTKIETREFVFDNKFDEKKVKPTVSPNIQTGTTLELSDYYKKTIHSKAFIRPEGVKDILLKTFFPTFYKKKMSGQSLVISVSLTVGHGMDEQSETPALIDVSQLPNLTTVPFDPKPAIMFQEMELGYHIDETYIGKLLIAGFNIDGRSMMVDNISDDSIPINTKAIFILSGTLFQADDTRQEIKVEEDVLRELKKRFAQEVDSLLKQEIPRIAEANTAITVEVNETFPHLATYFDSNHTGIINRERLVDNAAAKYMQDSREILQAEDLDSEAFEKAMDLSAKVLMEYVVFREKTLRRLEKINRVDLEDTIHNLIVPKSKNYLGSGKEVYLNNAWVLDEKFMTYSYILSDQALKTFIREVYPEANADKVSGEPDIAVLLSNENSTERKVDIVVVELKRLGIDLADEMHVVTQLYLRAEAILEFFKDETQRLWLYGIAEVSGDMARLLSNQGWSPLYSGGQYWHKTDRVAPKTSEDRIPVSFYIIPYDVMVSDARLRNDTFMNLLKRSIKEGRG